MPLQLEQIETREDQAFQLMFNPRLSDLFFWHFHPEYELVYIEGAEGNRRVGDHMSSFRGSDLVLIGSNIPHLNFDYGVRTDYQKVVVHIQPEFVKQHVQKVSELAILAPLFQRAKYGVAFHKPIKTSVGKALLHFQSLNPFQQYIQLLQLLQELASTDQAELLHAEPYINQYQQKEQGRMRAIFAYLDSHYHQKIQLETVARISNLSKEAFCRYFKKNTGKTFIDFLNQYRISQAKRLLMEGAHVNEACFACGFESLSYFSRMFKRITKETPSGFRGRYLAR